MANQLKYVILQQDNGLEFPVIFGEVITHKGMAKYAALILHRESDTEAEPVSAGFFQIHDGGFTCFGESKSLKLKSRGPVDDEVIRKWA